MLQKALGCLFVFGIAPVGIGGLWTKGMGQKREKILNLYLAGFLSELAVFQLIAVPVMVKEVYGMNLLVYLTTAVLAVLAVAGFIWTFLRGRLGGLRSKQQQAGQGKRQSANRRFRTGNGTEPHTANCSSKSGASAFLAAVFGISGISDVHGLCLCIL